MPDFVKYLNADVAMAVVAVVLTFICTQGVKALLPSPVPDALGAKPKRFAVIDQLEWMPFLAAFVFGIFFAVVFDLDKGEPILSKLRGGLQTGSYAVASWGAWSTMLRPLVEKAVGRSL